MNTAMNTPMNTASSTRSPLWFISDSPQQVLSPPPAAPRRKRGAITQGVLDAIADGHHTLRAISECLSLSYRDINAIVTSLEARGRVCAINGEARRGEREFHLTDRLAPPEPIYMAPLPYSVFTLSEPPRPIPQPDPTTVRIHRCLDDPEPGEYPAFRQAA